jgi:hypothetical protein
MLTHPRRPMKTGAGDGSCWGGRRGRHLACPLPPLSQDKVCGCASSDTLSHFLPHASHAHAPLTSDSNAGVWRVCACRWCLQGFT